MAQASLPGSDIGVLAENEVSSTMATNSQVVVQIPDSVSDLTVGSSGIEMSLSVPEGLISSTAPGGLRTTDNTTLQGLLSHSVTVSGHQLIAQPDGIQIIAVANPDFITSATGDNTNRVWQIVPGTSPEIATIVAVQDTEYEAQEVTQMGSQETSSNEVSSMVSSESLPTLLIPQPSVPQVLPPKCPAWAARLKNCEQIGDYYRGYVDSEVELDLLLTYHKQQTQSFWGTRQSPSQSRMSTRLMWKSQYVPFDGIPFINTGSRAVVMECQYGPRRKGFSQKREQPSQLVFTSPHTVEYNTQYENPSAGTTGFKKTCPARIYIKKVKKFLQFAVDPNQEKKLLKTAMDKSFQALRGRLLDVPGQERFYVQLPTDKAHEFHTTGSRETTDEQSGQRLHPQVATKIRELVASGETRLYAVRKAVRNFVSRVLFSGSTDQPERHDLSYFPTVNDLKNHIHLAMTDIENGTLALTAPTVNLEVLPSTDGVSDDQEVTEIKQVDNTLWTGQPGAEGDGPTPETVTVTLTQHPGEDGHHVISRIETHLSDGTTQISNTLTPETAQLLSNLHPSMFPGGCGGVVKLQSSQVQSSQESAESAPSEQPEETSDIEQPTETLPLGTIEMTSGETGMMGVAPTGEEALDVKQGDGEANISTDSAMEQLVADAPEVAL
ncbi:calcium-responsive transcription factor-like [Liolophura sinensis]|uniref:calcium-responsive transcription factor-like n=1 Tax=Liolophura sinensis TaxID=3198878 RepID=UPI003159606B